MPFKTEILFFRCDSISRSEAVSQSVTQDKIFTILTSLASLGKPGNREGRKIQKAWYQESWESGKPGIRKAGN